jgi:hypothetical protein
MVQVVLEARGLESSGTSGALQSRLKAALAAGVARQWTSCEVGLTRAVSSFLP